MLRDELVDRISRSEFYEWMVLEAIEPFGERGDYLRSGIVASTIANIHRGKNQKPLSPSDFIPKFDVPAVQGPDQMRAAFMALKKEQDAILRSKQKREARASARRDREIRKQAQGPRAHRQTKSARPGNKERR